VSFGDATLKVKALDYYDFAGTDICLMSAGSAVSKAWSPKIAAQRRDRHRQFLAMAHGPRRAVDRSGGERAVLEGGIKKGNHCQSQLFDRADGGGVETASRRRHDQTCRGVGPISPSRARGKDAMDELFRQTRAVFVADPIEKQKFSKQIAFNVIPHIDVFLDSGVTKEEWK